METVAVVDGLEKHSFLGEAGGCLKQRDSARDSDPILLHTPYGNKLTRLSLLLFNL